MGSTRRKRFQGFSIYKRVLVFLCIYVQGIVKCFKGDSTQRDEILNENIYVR